MAHRNKLLAAGLAGIAIVGLAPIARNHWEQRQARAAEEQQRLYIELKEREIACLERLAAGGLAKGANVEAEIERCRRVAVDPATGEVVKEAR